ncbi:MAG: D-alanine--D-alanine ligase [Chloroflexi bacterium]|nr:D-alanine--D-alanine ligase [Chloroflexota bacterium]
MAIDRDGHWLPISTSQALLTGGPKPDSTSLTVQGSGGLVPDANIGAVVDVVFPLLHGPFGEDGTVQGLLELLNVPYVGAGVAASAVGMDKVLMKSLFAQHGLPVLPYSVVRRAQWERDRRSVLRNILDMPGLPCFVKPANMGSSIGVSRCDGDADLEPAIERALSYDLKVLVEHGVPGYREIECAVLGNDEPEVSVPGEILIQSTFYDYHTKYTDGEAGLQVPAMVQAATAKKLQALSREAFMAIDAAGMSRVDFLVSPDESEIWLNEINTIPGFTPFSMYPQLWQASGVPYAELVSRLVDLALERHEEKARLRRDRADEDRA